jgi:hypothetical protein
MSGVAAPLEYLALKQEEEAIMFAIRVIYVRAIEKVVSYAHVIKKFSSICMPCTRNSLTHMPFWMDGELIEVLEGV